MPRVNLQINNLEKPKSKSFIYGLIDPDTNYLMYIGQTIQGFRRITEHYHKCNFINKNTKKRSPSKLWISNLRKQDKCFKVIYLEYTESSKLNEAEEYWISFIKASGGNLLNYSQNNGFTNTIKQVTLEDRIKISLATKEAMNNPITREKCRKNRAKQPAPNTGRKFPQEFKDKISKAQDNKVIYIKDSDGNVYRGLKDAAKHLNVTFGSIWKALNGYCKTVKGKTLTRIN